jgi:hypothetical protein
MEYEPQAARTGNDRPQRCVPRDGLRRALQTVQFIPIRFTFFNKLTKDDRSLVALDALVLSRRDWDAMSAWARSFTPESFQRSSCLRSQTGSFDLQTGVVVNPRRGCSSLHGQVRCESPRGGLEVFSGGRSHGTVGVFHRFNHPLHHLLE